MKEGTMVCILDYYDWYASVGSAFFTLGITVMFSILYCTHKDDHTPARVEMLEDKYTELSNKVDHNHQHYEKEVLLMLREVLNANSARSDPGDINSIPGGE